MYNRYNSQLANAPVDDIQYLQNMFINDRTASEAAEIVLKGAFPDRALTESERKHQVKKVETAFHTAYLQGFTENGHFPAVDLLIKALFERAENPTKCLSMLIQTVDFTTQAEYLISMIERSHDNIH